jgi:hypothetical protein
VNFEEAIGGVIEALKEYAEDWHDHLLNALTTGIAGAWFS